MKVVSDANTLNVLARMGLVHHLGVLYDKVFIPPHVAWELNNAPPVVRSFIESPPSWLENVPLLTPVSESLRHKGEREAIALAKLLHVPVILTDELKARSAARASGLETVNTLGILEQLSERGILSLRESLALLPKDYAIKSHHQEAALERERVARRQRVLDGAERVEKDAQSARSPLEKFVRERHGTSKTSRLRSPLEQYLHERISGKRDGEKDTDGKRHLKWKEPEPDR